MGCVSQDSHPRKSILREPGMLDQNTPSNSPRARGTKLKFGKERVHREASFKSVKFTNAIRALRDLRKEHMRKPCTKNDAPAKQRENWRKNYKVKNSNKATF